MSAEHQPPSSRGGTTETPTGDGDGRSGRGPRNGGNTPIRVLIADDHPTMRRSLRMLLAAQSDVETIGEVGDLETAEHVMHSEHPDVLVLARGLAAGPVADTLSHIRSAGSDAAVVLLSMDCSRGRAEHALRHGATAFVLKEHADSELGPAIRRVAGGRGFMSPHLDDGVSRVRGASGLPTRSASPSGAGAAGA